MIPSPFQEMQKAVDIVNASPHPTNKIAATVFGTDAGGMPFSVSYTNYWPGEISAHFSPDTRIGNSSGTIHAETACLLRAPRTKGAALCITDPFCPNCAKNMAEAGIQTIYIDHKGFDKDFAARRHHHFVSMSMQICEKSGINVYEIRRKEEKVIPILEAPASYQPVEDHPAVLEAAAALDKETLGTMAAAGRARTTGAFAVALAEDHRQAPCGLFAVAHPAIGYSQTDDEPTLKKPQGKYSFMLEPVNRILMNAARHGLKIKNGLLYSSQVPTAREQVNLVGAGIHTIYIGKGHKARDPDALAAMASLQEKNILEFRKLE